MRDERPRWDPPPQTVAQIRSAFPSGWEVVETATPADGRGDGRGASDEALRAVAGADVYIGWGVPDSVVEAARAGGLRWAHTLSAGVGASLGSAMRAADTILTNSAGIHADPMAETILAMILHFARGLDFAVHAQQHGRWDQSAFIAADSPIREVNGATLGILGLGGIGRAVARRALALGMQVIGLRRHPGREGPAGVEMLDGDGALDRLLARSYFLVVAVPETSETRGMLGPRELALLPAGALLVNVARGGVLDEQALIERLRGGHLRGAALDVFAHEPLPANSPLWALSNVLVLPHVSPTSNRFWRRQVDLIADNARRFLAGQPLLNTVDKHAGY